VDYSLIEAEWVIAVAEAKIRIEQLYELTEETEC
jgi:hypothetical protein